MKLFFNFLVFGLIQIQMVDTNASAKGPNSNVNTASLTCARTYPSTNEGGREKCLYGEVSREEITRRKIVIPSCSEVCGKEKTALCVNIKSKPLLNPGDGSLYSTDEWCCTCKSKSD